MATVATSAAIHHALVLDRQELAPGVVLLGFDAPELVRVTHPGQFVMAIPPGGERAATALGIYEASGNRASVMFFVVGKRTAELAALRVGDRLTLEGPLGNGFTLDNVRNAAIVAGGVGIASVLLPAQALLRAGCASATVLRCADGRVAGRSRAFRDPRLRSARFDRRRKYGPCGLHYGCARASDGSARPDSCLRTHTDVARRRTRRARDERSSATFAGRDFRVRCRRLLGVRRSTGAHVGASAELSARRIATGATSSTRAFAGRARCFGRTNCDGKYHRHRLECKDRQTGIAVSDVHGQRMLRQRRRVCAVHRSRAASAASCSRA